MKFHSLMKLLGEPQPKIWRHPESSRLGCDLPMQSFDRIMTIDGYSTRAIYGELAAFDVLVDEGIARIMGRVQVDDDGRQTLRDVMASLIDADEVMQASAEDDSEEDEEASEDDAPFDVDEILEDSGDLDTAAKAADEADAETDGFGGLRDEDVDYRTERQAQADYEDWQQRHQ